MPDLRASLSHGSTIGLLVAGIALILAVTTAIGSPLLSGFVTELFIHVVLVVGLQVFMGNTNILWFPHIGFMGIGAYASVIFSMDTTQKLMSLPELYPFLEVIHIGFVPAILCGALVAAAVAAVIGFPMMRLSDFPAVIAGFALLVVIHVVLVHWSALTNGPQTLFGVDRHTYAATAALWAIFALIVGYLFKESRIGLQLRASREDLIAAQTIGIRIMFVRWIALIVSAFIAGLGGGLYAHYITAFMPGAFFLEETFVVLSMLVIGGPATISGACLGAFLITLFYQSLRWIENSEMVADLLPGGVGGLSTLALAIALIAVLIWRPGGVVAREELSWETVSRAGAALKRRLRPKAAVHE
ncbi:branched-chain amino acid ABC transporter permease [Halofilum ochraceum]|uniref:branched-chain amino acid ABC transporter permease n=1 Tax=Halofilum ochraceum TaxID=1611323 RepID=UPI00082F498A|nr:branched-chain amino acid ABC transporter permease [Halofilum ochraceum]